jgi:hypothetical protein
MTVQTSDLTQARNLYTADSVGGNPATSNVRFGTVFGPANELTGTCHVPGAASTLVGVPTDNTVGTATISAADIRAALGLASANLDTQLAAIPTTGLTAQDVLTNPERTLTEGGQGGSTPEDIAGAVRTELTPELSRVANCATVESTGDQLAGLL